MGRLLRWSGHVQAPGDHLTQLGNEAPSLSRGHVWPDPGEPSLGHAAAASQSSWQGL